MNWDQVEGQWNTFKAKVRQKWGKLTDDDMEQIGGKKDELLARLQTRYGAKKDEMEKSLDEWLVTMDKKDRDDARRV
jgi:uncharacterized protein YjbJ (UPF0337 family)